MSAPKQITLEQIAEPQDRWKTIQWNAKERKVLSRTNPAQNRSQEDASTLGVAPTQDVNSQIAFEHNTIVTPAPSISMTSISPSSVTPLSRPSSAPKSGPSSLRQSCSSANPKERPPSTSVVTHDFVSTAAVTTTSTASPVNRVETKNYDVLQSPGSKVDVESGIGGGMTGRGGEAVKKVAETDRRPGEVNSERAKLARTECDGLESADVGEERGRSGNVSDKIVKSEDPLAYAQLILNVNPEVRCVDRYRIYPRMM